MKRIVWRGAVRPAVGAASLAPPPRVRCWSSCSRPKAARAVRRPTQLLASLQRDQPVGAAEIIPLGLHVDYWDRLGWKDPFSSAAFTDRQQQYSRIFGDDRVYTPQMVVDGAGGIRRQRSERGGARGNGGGRPSAPAAERDRDATADIGPAWSIDLPAAPAGVRADSGRRGPDRRAALTSSVLRGENRGRTLQHVAVVRRLQALGSLETDAFVAEGQWRLERALGRVRLERRRLAAGVEDAPRLRRGHRAGRSLTSVTGRVPARRGQH